MYFLLITNTQNRTTKLVCENLSQCENIIKAIEETNNICLYRIFSDEYEAIKRSHNDTRLTDAV